MPEPSFDPSLNAATTAFIRGAESASCETPQGVQRPELERSRALSKQQLGELRELLAQQTGWRVGTAFPHESVVFWLRGPAGEAGVSVCFPHRAWLVVGPSESQGAPLDEETAQRIVELLYNVYPELAPWPRRRALPAEARVLERIRSAFQGVKLGEGVGLRQADGLDDYADAKTLAALRAKDEKDDWSAIPSEDLRRYQSSPSFFDAEGMRFHLPAYLVADLQGAPGVDVLFHLTHLDAYNRSRFELFDEAQRRAVREFLLLRLPDPNYGYVQPMIEQALAEFWTA